MDVLGRGTEGALQRRREGVEGASGESRGKEGGAERGNEKAWVSRHKLGGREEGGKEGELSQGDLTDSSETRPDQA